MDQRQPANRVDLVRQFVGLLAAALDAIRPLRRTIQSCWHFAIVRLK
jgi:hypothetical protein